jgi:transposase
LRGGRTTKIHARSDPDCRPRAFHLTPGQDADITAAPAFLALAPPMSSLIADKGYDGDKFRADIVNRGAKPVIPNKSNRIALHRFNKRAYEGRNVIERCFYRLKDFRRIATRYDKLARNFLAAVQLAAIVAYWIKVWTLVGSLRPCRERQRHRAPNRVAACLPSLGTRPYSAINSGHHRMGGLHICRPSGDPSIAAVCCTAENRQSVLRLPAAALVPRAVSLPPPRQAAR